MKLLRWGNVLRKKMLMVKSLEQFIHMSCSWRLWLGVRSTVVMTSCPPDETFVLSFTQNSKIFFDFLTRMSPVRHHPLILNPKHSFWISWWMWRSWWKTVFFRETDHVSLRGETVTGGSSLITLTLLPPSLLLSRDSSFFFSWQKIRSQTFLIPVYLRTNLSLTSTE